MRVDTIFHALTTIYSRNMSDKRVILSFQLNLSKSVEGVNTNLQNASVEQRNDPRLNEKLNEETILKEIELFYPPKNYVFAKRRVGT